MTSQKLRKLILIGIGIFAIVLVMVWASEDKVPEIRGKWQAAYYPDGCLDCTDKWIFSPFFETANECINWVHSKAEARNNNSDAAECSYDCRKRADFGGLVCKETVDVLGKPSF